jgi:hypothetical protein
MYIYIHTYITLHPKSNIYDIYVYNIYDIYVIYMSNIYDIYVIYMYI